MRSQWVLFAIIAACGSLAAILILLWPKEWTERLKATKKPVDTTHIVIPVPSDTVIQTPGRGIYKVTTKVEPHSSSRAKVTTVIKKDTLFIDKAQQFVHPNRIATTKVRHKVWAERRILRIKKGRRPPITEVKPEEVIMYYK